MKISDGSESYEAPPDGKDHPRNGDSHSTVSLRIIDDYSLEETDKTDGKVTGVSRSTIRKRWKVDEGRSFKYKTRGDHDVHG